MEVEGAELDSGIGNCVLELGAAYTDGIVEDESAADNQPPFDEEGETGIETLAVEEEDAESGLIVDEEPLPRDWDTELSVAGGGTVLVELRAPKVEEV